MIVEDGIKHGGIASTVSELFREEGLSLPIHSIGVPLEFLEHSKRDEIFSDLGITVQTITRSLVSWSLTLRELEISQNEESSIRQESN